MIRSIQLANFKSYELETAGLGALTLIVGANASGKSNIRDALRFLHGVGLGYSCAEIIGGKYGPGGIRQWRGIRGGPPEIARHGKDEFSLEIEVVVPQGVARYYLGVSLNNGLAGPRVIAEDLCLDDDMVFDSDPKDPLAQRRDHELRVRQKRGGNHRAHGKVSEFPSHTPALSQFPHRPKEPAHLRKVCEAVLGVLASMRFLDLDPDAMREASPPGQVTLGDRGENLSSVLQAICEDPKRKLALLGWVRSLTPMDAQDFDFKYDLGGKVLVYLVEGNGAATSAVSASDGTLRFLALVAALLSPDVGRLYFFEEFDNGIHPTRLHLLLDLVQQACEEQAVQVIGTTHNPALLAFLSPESRAHAILAYRPEGSASSKLRRILDLPDVERILETQDLGRLHAAGWLEDAAEFSEPDEVAG